jgi:HPr kinase/phosphorylase
MASPSSYPTSATTVRALLADAAVADLVRLVAGEASLDRPLRHPRIQKSGLVLVGHTRGVVRHRVQILGETELSFLESLTPDERRARCEFLFSLELSLVVLTRGVEPLPELVQAARASETPFAVMEPRSSRAIAAIHAVLDRLLAPSETLHGVLIDVHGIGTLLLGPSGIGKSECALFLVERGHRLVADDQVILTRTPLGDVIGRPPALLRHHLELRGIGIVNVRELFGATAVREDKAVQLVIELCPWDPEREFDRLGLDDLRHDLLGVSLPMLRIPVQPGRNMAVILEVAARNQLLKSAGKDAAREFVRALHARLGVTPDD